MKKIIIIPKWDWFGQLGANIQKGVPESEIYNNFEQVLAMVKAKEVERICVIMGSWMETADEVVEKTHAINPNIPILVWDWDPKRLASNEIYLESKDYDSDRFYEINEAFLNGEDLINIQKNKSI